MILVPLVEIFRSMADELLKKSSSDSVFGLLSEFEPKKKILPKKCIQTEYRESEAQTTPWDPPYRATIHEANNEPEILSLKLLTFGNGLPIRDVEFNYLIEVEHNKKALRELEIKNLDSPSLKNTIRCDQIRNEFNYRVGVENERQLDKLHAMNKAAIENLIDMSQKKDFKLRYLWKKKGERTRDRNLVLEEKLRRDKLNVDNQFLNKNGISAKKTALKKPGQRNAKIEAGKSFMLSEYFLSESNVKKWLDTRPEDLIVEIPIVRTVSKSRREKLAQQAYESLLIKKKPKMPQKEYREDFVKESPKAPAVNAEDLVEFFDFEEVKEDLVTVLQKSLRGLSCQKQMEELIERHRDGLSFLLTSPGSAATVP